MSITLSGCDYVTTSLASMHREAALVSLHLKSFLGKKAGVNAIHGQMFCKAVHADGTVTIANAAGKGSTRLSVYLSGLKWHARFDIENPVNEERERVAEINNAGLLAATEGRLFGFVPGPTLALGGTVVRIDDPEHLPLYPAYADVPVDNADVLLYRAEIDEHIRQLGAAPRSWPKLSKSPKPDAPAPVTPRNRPTPAQAASLFPRRTR